MKAKAQVLVLVFSALCAEFCVCLIEANAAEQVNERDLIHVVQRWEPGKPKQPVVVAIRLLGQQKSTNAVDVLIERIAFSSAPTLTTRVMASSDSVQLTTESLPCVEALIAIGRPAAGRVAARLAEIDSETGVRDAFLLRQVLLGMMQREEAAALLRQTAENARNNETKRMRLLRSAEKLSTDPQLSK